MMYRASSAPQLKSDTYPTLDLRYVTESAEIWVHNVMEGNRKTTFSSRVQEWESVKMHVVGTLQHLFAWHNDYLFISY
jgi:hypothetical protein